MSDSKLYKTSCMLDAIKNKISTLSDEDLNDLTSSLDTLSTIFKKLK